MLVALAAEPSSPVCAVGVSRKISAAPGLVVVNVAMPTIFTSKVPGCACTERVSPIPRCLRSAVSASRSASARPCGACPEVSRTGLCLVTYQLVTMVGAPVVGPTGLCRLSTTVICWVAASMCAAATPSTFRTFAAREAGTVGVAPVGTDDLRSSFGPIVTSAAVEAKSRSKVRVTVSEKIRLPATNATERTTASADSSSRPLCARKLRSVALSTGHSPSGAATGSDTSVAPSVSGAAAGGAAA
jgi:hypothetical protein